MSLCPTKTDDIYVLQLTKTLEGPIYSDTDRLYIYIIAIMRLHQFPEVIDI